MRSPRCRSSLNLARRYTPKIPTSTTSKRSRPWPRRPDSRPRACGSIRAGGSVATSGWRVGLRIADFQYPKFPPLIARMFLLLSFLEPSSRQSAIRNPQSLLLIEALVVAEIADADLIERRFLKRLA